MNKVPSLLIVSWNRREYFERMIDNLLSDPSDFRIHFWDNGSTDGVKDIISSLDDERIVDRRYSPSNVGQFEPWHWFLDRCSTEVGGKLDDDIIAPLGWMARFSTMLTSELRLGLLGGWVFLESDWDERRAARKIETIGQYRIFRNLHVPGCVFLGRIDTLRKFAIRDPRVWGVPINQAAIWKNGLVTGYPLPLEFCENLDDPRSPHCRMNRPGGWDQFAAYTARMRNFSGPEEYAQWIAADAAKILELPLETQYRMLNPSISTRLQAAGRRVFRRLVR